MARAERRRSPPTPPSQRATGWSARPSRAARRRAARPGAQRRAQLAQPGRARGGRRRRARRMALEVAQAPQARAQVGWRQARAVQRRPTPACQPRSSSRSVKGLGQALLEQAAAHRRDGAVDVVHERAGARARRGRCGRPRGCAASPRRAPGGRRGALNCRLVTWAGRFSVSAGEVAQHGAGGGRRPARASASSRPYGVSAGHLEVVQQRAAREGRVEPGGVDRIDDDPRQRGAPGVQALGVGVLADDDLAHRVALAEAGQRGALQAAAELARGGVQQRPAARGAPGPSPLPPPRGRQARQKRPEAPSSSSGVVAVPGLMTSTTSRLTRPLASAGSSTCSQMATVRPAFSRRDQVGVQRVVRHAGQRDRVCRSCCRGWSG